MPAVKLKLALIVLICGWIGNLHAQTIINVERLSEGIDSTVFSVALSYEGTKGNANTDELDISLNTVFIRKRNEFKLFGGESLLAESGTEILNTAYAHARHNFEITERLKTFEFYQIQFNEVIHLNRREVAGAGLRYEFVQQDSIDFHVGAGAMREVELLDEAKLDSNEVALTRFYRANVFMAFHWKIGDIVTLINIAYYQPRFADMADFRFVNDFNLILKVTKHIEVVNEVALRYDSKPPSTLGNLDLGMNVGLNLKF